MRFKARATTVCPGLLVKQHNRNATAGDVNQVYSKGVKAKGTNNAIIRGNTVYVESFLGTGVGGLEFGTSQHGGRDPLFEKNKFFASETKTSARSRIRHKPRRRKHAHGQKQLVADVRNDQTTERARSHHVRRIRYSRRLGHGTLRSS